MAFREVLETVVANVAGFGHDNSQVSTANEAVAQQRSDLWRKGSYNDVGGAVRLFKLANENPDLAIEHAKVRFLAAMRSSNYQKYQEAIKEFKALTSFPAARSFILDEFSHYLPMLQQDKNHQLYNALFEDVEKFTGFLDTQLNSSYFFDSYLAGHSGLEAIQKAAGAQSQFAIVDEFEFGGLANNLSHSQSEITVAKDEQVVVKDDSAEEAVAVEAMSTSARKMDSAYSSYARNRAGMFAHNSAQHDTQAEQPAPSKAPQLRK